MEILSKCKPAHFLSNFKEINSYFQARKSIPVISNIPRLIKIIQIFFETVLFYQEHSSRKFYININGAPYKIQINGHDINNRPVSNDLLDISETLLTDILSEIKKSISPDIFKHLIELLNAILLTPKILISHKISIINSENKVFNQEWRIYVRLLPEKIALDSLQIRKNFIYQILQLPKKYLPDLESFDQNIVTLHSAYEFYLKTIINVHIAKNHYVDIFKTIYDELENINKLADYEYVDADRLIHFLLLQVVLQNNLFQLEKKDKVREIIDEYATHVDSDKLKLIYDGLNFNPENFELANFTIELGEPTFADVNLDEIKTLFSFVVPYHINEKFLSFDLIDKTRIEFEKVENLFEDPIFSFLESADININGMPLTFFSDSLVGNLDNSTLIDITINEFYHPDFELNDNKVIPKSFDIEEAKRGGIYYPHKDFILEKLWSLYNEKTFPIDIERKGINSNFISNYLVSYLDKSNKLIHHKLFTITNIDSYFKVRNRFIDNLNKQYIEEDLSDIKEFILDFRIFDRKSFLDFCCKLLELTLKKSIEFGGLWSAFWTEKDGILAPILEPDAQPIIYNHIRYLFEIKGIKVSREIAASDGNLDFHFYYNKNDRPMNVCMELKNAHAGNKLEHGLKTQLPLYLKDIGNREGIYLVLWYKSKEFNNPKQFNTVKDLEGHLSNLIPKKLKIKVIIIDCTKKSYPSQKAANKRLN